MTSVKSRGSPDLKWGTKGLSKRLRCNAIRMGSRTQVQSIYPQGVTRLVIELEEVCARELLRTFEEEKNIFHLTGFDLQTIQQSVVLVCVATIIHLFKFNICGSEHHAL